MEPTILSTPLASSWSSHPLREVSSWPQRGQTSCCESCCCFSASLGLSTYNQRERRALTPEFQLDMALLQAPGLLGLPGSWCPESPGLLVSWVLVLGPLGFLASWVSSFLIS